MAYGIPCKNCGWQETEHHCVRLPNDLLEIVNRRLPSRKFSLAKCPSFEYPKDSKALVKRLAKEQPLNKDAAYDVRRNLRHFIGDNPD